MVPDDAIDDEEEADEEEDEALLSVVAPLSADDVALDVELSAELEELSEEELLEQAVIATAARTAISEVARKRIKFSLKLRIVRRFRHYYRSGSVHLSSNGCGFLVRGFAKQPGEQSGRDATKVQGRPFF